MRRLAESAWKILVSGLIWLPLAGHGEGLRLDSIDITPGQVARFKVPLNARSKADLAHRGVAADSAEAALILPVTFDLSKPCHLVVISVPSGSSSISALASYTNAVLSEGWGALAVDGPPASVEEDTIQRGWAMLFSGLDYLTHAWPQARQWTMVCAGFSGGAKRSGSIAAAMMKENYRVIGMFMGGCNEDRATQGAKMYAPGELFKSVPIFLSSGLQDPIAGPTQAAVVKQSLQRTGFRFIRLETYAGGHRLDAEQVKLALRWFLQPRRA